MLQPLFEVLFGLLFASRIKSKPLGLTPKIPTTWPQLTSSASSPGQLSTSPVLQPPELNHLLCSHPTPSTHATSILAVPQPGASSPFQGPITLYHIFPRAPVTMKCSLHPQQVTSNCTMTFISSYHELCMLFPSWSNSIPPTRWNGRSHSFTSVFPPMPASVHVTQQVLFNLCLWTDK